ncbi:MAG: alpha/beta fold hydrolase [Ignavibacteria bacterium]|nr:alpha/beta fold hydrolase [Ignavibacteria bacterium]
MRRFLWLVVLVFVLALPSLAQLPPLIDRDLFFGDPEISGAQISPDGKYISFLKPFMNVRNIWVKERHEPFEKARPITADTTRPVMIYFWSHDSRYVLYAQDKGGDENYRVYAVNPGEKGDPVPPARDLTPYKGVRAMIIAVPKKTPNTIVVGLNDRRADLHDVYTVDLSTGERTLVRKNDDNIAGWSTDLDGKLRLGIRVTADGGNEILQIEGESLKQIYAVSPYESAGPSRFTPDGKKFYMVTNKGEDRDKIQLELFDLATGRTTLVEKDPLNEVDFAGALFSDVTEEILATYYIGERIRIYPKQKKFAETYEKMKKALPEGEISFGSTTADETLWMVAVSSDVDPGSRYLFDVKTGKTEFLYKSRPKLPSENLAPMKPVRYTARDGMTIHAYLTLPKGIAGKSLPTIMLIHGGPWARDIWGYNAEAQFLANRGYAVLQPNFRGSTGYGKKYLNAGNKQWGTGSMQHDISDAVQYLIKEGIADPKRVGIYGGSYGGYATLAGLAFTPDLYAAGVSYVGPSNIITLLNSIPPYWAPIKKIFNVRVGDIDNSEDVKRLETQSPLNSAKQIKAPLQVVQGANDPRVKKAESDQIVVAMRELNRPVEYLVAPDEGHGFAGKENRLAFYTAMETFLAKHLKGRFQDSMTPEVKKKLNDLTVDIKTVTMPEKPSAEEMSPVPSFTGTGVKPFTAEYSAKMKMMGQEFTVTSKRIVSQAQWNGKKIWRLIEESSTPMGAAVDTVDLVFETLQPARRSLRQGPATINMVFTADAVKGKIQAGPQEMPLDIKYTGPIVLDGASMELCVGTLPLAPGYSATLTTVEIMRGKSKQLGLKVTGAESVTVAAGTFDAFVVEVKPLDDNSGGSKIWIAKNDKRTVKTETKLPATMGGGTVVSELSK